MSETGYGAVYETIVPQFALVLKNLLAMLDKVNAFADHKKIDAKVLLNSRLAPDQFHFTRQVQIACDVAKGAAARAAGQEPPKHEDTEQTVEDLKARIKKTVDFLNTIKMEQFAGYEKRTFPIGWMPGKGLPATEFIARMTIPNFYFHVTTAYSILRHNGLDIGKNDYLGAINFRNL